MRRARRFDDPASEVPGERHRALPKTSWRTRRYLWAPWLGMTGIQRIHLVRGARGARVLVLAGAGVGGGSLVYANTLYVPPPPFFADPQWRHITDWRAELMPFYEQAQRMLGVTGSPTMTAADKAVKKVAERMGRGDTFRPTPVGVYLGDEPGREDADPYFGGRAPPARHVQRMRRVHDRLPPWRQEHADRELPLPRRAGRREDHPDDDGHRTAARRRRRVRGRGQPHRGGGRARASLTAGQVVLAAGTYGTQRLLHRMKATGALPGLSARLGAMTRTNSEAILAVERRRRVPR